REHRHASWSWGCSGSLHSLTCSLRVTDRVVGLQDQFVAVPSGRIVRDRTVLDVIVGINIEILFLGPALQQLAEHQHHNAVGDHQDLLAGVVAAQGAQNAVKPHADVRARLPARWAIPILALFVPPGDFLRILRLQTLTGQPIEDAELDLAQPFVLDDLDARPKALEARLVLY